VGGTRNAIVTVLKAFKNCYGKAGFRFKKFQELLSLVF
jgi:hypothetical protein